MSDEVAAPISALPTPTTVRSLWRRRLDEYGPSILLVIFLLFLWEGIVWYLTIPDWLLPPPSRIATTLIVSLPILFGHTLATLTVTIPGFSLALIGGFGLGIALDASPLLRRTIYPLLVTSQTVPIVAIAPLLVVGFGFGLLPKVIVVALVTFFPIVVNTIDGLQNADRDQRRLLEAMGANYWQLLRLLRLRAALPAIFTGIKVAITYSVIGAVLAEWIGASAGLGVYIARSLRAFRTDQVFVAALVTSLLTIVLFTLVNLLERKIVFWKGEH